MKKRKLWAELGLWETCRKQALELGLTISIDGDPEYPMAVSREGAEVGDHLFRVARCRELSDYLDGYERGKEDHS